MFPTKTRLLLVSTQLKRFCSLTSYKPCYLYLISIDGQDYSAQQMIFYFSNDNTQECFDVDILDDDISEPEKKFLLMLTIGDPQINLSPDTTIIDNDGKYQFQ